MKEGKLGIALVGLGNYSGKQLAPALQQTEHCYLAALVSGSPEKLKDWAGRYGVKEQNCYSYQNFSEIKDNDEVDIVYVVVPNALHAGFVIKAAEAGKHIICEKPMAVTVEDCDRMIEACARAGVMLSLGYRLHFEPHNREVMRLGQQKVLGEIKKVEAAHGLAETGGWRIDKKLAGGGPLMDVGIYCVQAVRYATGLEPIAVRAKEHPKTDPGKFDGVEESLEWEMEMPGGVVAFCKSSYTEKQNFLKVTTQKGWYELKPAYPYSGIQGDSSEGKLSFPEVNQQAKQMDAFAQCIKNGKPTTVSGEEGRRDVKILQAIYQAMRTGERVLVDAT